MGNDFIDKDSAIPYYIQLKQILLHKINSNSFENGRLPSEKELSTTYDIPFRRSEKYCQNCR